MYTVNKSPNISILCLQGFVNCVLGRMHTVVHLTENKIYTYRYLCFEKYFFKNPGRLDGSVG